MLSDRVPSRTRIAPGATDRLVPPVSSGDLHLGQPRVRAVDVRVSSMDAETCSAAGASDIILVDIAPAPICLHGLHDRMADGVRVSSRVAHG